MKNMTALYSVKYDNLINVDDVYANCQGAKRV